MKSKQVNPSFKFWYENKVADERNYFISDIIQQFQKWLKKKERDWLAYYGTEQVVTFFIGDKEGLNSVCEQKDVPELVRRMKPALREHLGYHDTHAYLKQQ